MHAEQPRAIFGLRPMTAGLLLLFLVAMDSLATILMLRDQRGWELNPLMHWLFQRGELTFLCIRLALAGLCAAWIVMRARYACARLAALIGFSIYVPVVALHVYTQTVIR